MGSNLTYDKAVADIIKMSATGDTAETQLKVMQMCQVFQEFLLEFADKSDGYMFLAAFNVAFVEMKRIINAAEGADKVLLTQIVSSIIGSFGKTVQ